MINKKLLVKARHKFKTSNEDIPTDGSFNELLVKYYLKYEPSKRGKALESHFINSLQGLVSKTPEKWESGDFHINCDYMFENKCLKSINNFLHSDKLEKRVKDKKLIQKIKNDFNNNLIKTCSTFFELKTSYLNDRGYYRIGNIRTYQKYDNLLLLLIDCEDSFKYNIYLIPMSEIHTFNMCHMHGTTDSNKDTQNPHLSFSIAKGSQLERDMDKWRLPFGFKYLINKIESFKRKELDTKFIDESLFNTIIDDEMKKNLKLIGGHHYLKHKEIDIISYFNEKIGNCRKEVIYHNKSYVWGFEQLLAPQYFWYDENNNLVMDYYSSSIYLEKSVYFDITNKFKLRVRQFYDYLPYFLFKHNESYGYVKTITIFENNLK